MTGVITRTCPECGDTFTYRHRSGPIRRYCERTCQTRALNRLFHRTWFARKPDIA